MNEIYWITRLDGINTLVTVILVLSAIVVIVSFVFYLISFDRYACENPLNVRKLTIKLFKIGIPILIISAIALGFYSVLIKPLVNKHPPLVVTFYATIPGAIIFSPGIPQLLREIPEASTVGWLGVLGLSIIVSGFGYTANSYAVNYLGVSKTVIVYYLVPPVAIIYTAILFREFPLPLEYLGVAVVILGVVLARSAKSKES